MKYNLAFACAAMLALPACLDSNNGSTRSNTNSAADIQLEDLGARALAFERTFGDTSPTIDLPTGDGVEYTGVAFYGERQFPELTQLSAATSEGDNFNQQTTFLAVGEARITANFDARNVEVEADNFFQIDEPNDVDLVNFSNLENATGTAIAGEMEGTLRADNFGITRTEVEQFNSYSGAISGDLTRVGDQEGTDATMWVNGRFLGEGAEAFVATTPGLLDNQFGPSKTASREISNFDTFGGVIASKTNP